MTGYEAEALGRRMALHLRKNCFEACHNILDAAEETRSTKEKETPMAVVELPLDLRTVNMLEKAGYVYVKDLEGVDFDELVSSTPNVGKKTAKRLKEIIGEALQEIEGSKVVVEDFTCASD